MIELTEQCDQYQIDFAGRSPQRTDCMTSIRAAAMDRFNDLGFPTRRDEEWRYTNVSPIANTTFQPAARIDTPLSSEPSSTFDDAEMHRLVIVNGQYEPDLSSPGHLPDGVTLTNLTEVMDSNPSLVERHLAQHASYQNHAFTALNTAFIHDGAVLALSDGVRLERPVHLVFVTQSGHVPCITHPRTLVVLGEAAEASVIESYIGANDANYFTNAVTELVVAPGAVLDHYKVGQDSNAAFHVGTTQIHQQRDTNVRSHCITISGGLVRNDINVVLDGEGAHCTLNGLYLPTGDQHVDNHLRIEHAQPNCNSWEYFKGILDGAAHAVFTGRIIVHKDAQKTDAKQTNMNLLLSDSARVDTKPQLEILADDVKCTHGATIGQLDDEALFYLKARGIPAESARSLLILAFAGEVLDEIRPETLRESLRQVLVDRLPRSEFLRDT